jgi:hypothetical protein
LLLSKAEDLVQPKTNVMECGGSVPGEWKAEVTPSSDIDM